MNSKVNSSHPGFRTPQEPRWAVAALMRWGSAENHAQCHITGNELAIASVPGGGNGYLHRDRAGGDVEIELVGDGAARVVVDARHPGGVERLCVPETSSVSCDLRVFVDDTADQIASAGTERAEVSDCAG